MELLTIYLGIRHMKVKYITTIAIATILGLVTTNVSYGNFKASTNSNSTTVSSKVAQSNPCAGKANPCAGKANPCAGKANPCAGKENPCAGKANPCAGKANPCAGKANPCAGKENPCAGKANPCAGKSSTATLHPQFYTEKGVALDGQDVVAYFTQSKLVMGVSQFKHNWGGTTWMFASAANRDMFAKNPEKYAPQYGGYCAQGTSEAHLVVSQPDAWKIVNGKLYLNYDKTVQAQWMGDIPGHIALANKNWPAILNNKELFR
ncbi:YHS domain-containing (seleno)protein [Microcoleus sp. AT3-D2]|uniref:YHS domain-containing (seleno)protein n=1 Tax=Microcoleus sp. AT3-D2 TaxID=2818612 RepID=UPI002FCF2990